LQIASFRDFFIRLWLTPRWGPPGEMCECAFQ
jgi:hypothetical protein